VPRPDVKGREGILKVHTRRVPIGGEVQLDVIAKGTPGFSGADLESLVNEAALLAARKDKDRVDMVDFEEAKDKVLMGPERKSMVISEREKRTTAYHEAGHALVAKMLPAADPVHKVTIIPRGPALGVTQQLPAEDRLSYSKEWAQNRIAIMLGGRIAEEIIFGQQTTGAGNDLEKATELAHKMVCEWGMSDKMGPLTFGKKEENVFLGREMAGNRQDYSEETARTIDVEVRAIVMDGYAVAHKILSENLQGLKDIAEALLEHETIDGEDIGRLMKGDKIERRPPPRPPVKQEVRPEVKEKRPSLFAPPELPTPEPEKA
jgi:cell division protease FtsH